MFPYFLSLSKIKFLFNGREGKRTKNRKKWKIRREEEQDKNARSTGIAIHFKKNYT